MLPEPLSNKRVPVVRFKLEVTPRKNDKIRMTNDETTPSDQIFEGLLCIFEASSLDIRAPSLCM